MKKRVGLAPAHTSASTNDETTGAAEKEAVQDCCLYDYDIERGLL